MSTKQLKPIIPATSSSASARAILAAAAASASSWSGYSRKAATASSTASSISGGDSVQMEKPKRKRQRLDHLTQEEKIMRRKLKNRMAAQSARDRKKVKMQDLEGEVTRIQEENEQLIKRNAYLEKRLKMLELENDTLRKRLANGTATSDEYPVASSSSTNLEESLLRLMNGMPNTDCGIMEDEDQWSDAEDDIVFDDVNMMADSYSSNSNDGNQSDVSDDSGLVMNFSTGAVSPSGSLSASATTSPLRRLADESIESAELISEPQQKDQDLKARRRAAVVTAEAAELLERSQLPQESPSQSQLDSRWQPQPQCQVRSTVITSTSSYLEESSQDQSSQSCQQQQQQQQSSELLEEHPLNLKISSSTSSSRSTASKRPVKQRSQESMTFSPKRLMNFLVPLLSLMMAASSSSQLEEEETPLPPHFSHKPSRASRPSMESSARRPSSSSLPASISAPQWSSLLAAATREASRLQRSRVRLRLPPDDDQ